VEWSERNPSLPVNNSGLGAENLGPSKLRYTNYPTGTKPRAGPEERDLPDPNRQSFERFMRDKKGK
jgi:hypothetical protein